MAQPYRNRKAGVATWARRLGLGLGLVSGFVAGPVAAADGAAVFLYHRFGESRYPSTNIGLPQFEAHLRELKSGGYAVLPLQDVLDAVRTQKPLPDRAVALTIDDAHLSAYAEAWPRLKAAGFPFTLFIATDPVDAKTPDYMNWDQIREFVRGGVAIGSQTASHPHMPGMAADAVKAELAKSNARFQAELGLTPTIFAYPYGEASLANYGPVRDAGFQFALGQHSGVVGSVPDLYYLPRFALNESFGDLDRFKRAANALPLPVRDVTPLDPFITTNNPPAIGFTVADSVVNLDRLRCYSSSESSAKIERLGEKRFEIRLSGPLPKGRSRLNCTAPGPGGRWQWTGWQYYVRP